MRRGNVTLDQQRAVVHPTNNPNEPVSLSADNLVTLTATITDKDGDSASAVLNIGQNLVFLDDGPTTIAPALAMLPNAVGATFTGSLDAPDGNIDDNVGADQPGTISFANIIRRGQPYRGCQRKQRGY